MTHKRIALGGLRTQGFQIITLANSTAVSLNSTVSQAHVIDFSAATNAVRVRADAVATLTTGVLYEKDVHHRLQGISGGGTYSFQRAAGGTSVVQVQGWRHEA